ncbi:MAG: GxxExxY protein [Planctomycetaceae bacterium]|nr:GxxExxY protein [Planctomycetaceae bacterium]
MAEIVFKEESFQIMGACFEAYNEMGYGFLECVYQECLCLEFVDRRIPFASQVELDLRYKQTPLSQKYIPDFICFDSIIIELKSARELSNAHRAQIHNYLKATGYKLGLLVNFGSHPKLEYERIVL